MAKCKVTRMNDTSLFDVHGFVQTWRKEEKEKTVLLRNRCVKTA